MKSGAKFVKLIYYLFNMRLVVALIAACAQALADTPICYIDPVYTDDQLVITKDIYFGENMNKVTKEN
jgi:hypothetical protein